MLDCRGLACPQPVIRTKELLDAGGVETVEVMVDNKAASINVSRFLESRGFSVQTRTEGDDFTIVAVWDSSKEADESEPPEAFTCGIDPTKILVFIRSDTMGRGDDTLGRGLMKNFLLTLPEMGPDLWRIMFVNSGVKLCIEGAETLETIQKLEQSGVSVLVCGTCLTHFDLLEQKKVGETTNMLDIVTSLQLADKVITI